MPTGRPSSPGQPRLHLGSLAALVADRAGGSGPRATAHGRPSRPPRGGRGGCTVEHVVPVVVVGDRVDVGARRVGFPRSASSPTRRCCRVRSSFQPSSASRASSGSGVSRSTRELAVVEAGVDLLDPRRGAVDLSGVEARAERTKLASHTSGGRVAAEGGQRLDEQLLAEGVVAGQRGFHPRRRSTGSSRVPRSTIRHGPALRRGWGVGGGLGRRGAPGTSRGSSAARRCSRGCRRGRGGARLRGGAAEDVGVPAPGQLLDASTRRPSGSAGSSSISGR